MAKASVATPDRPFHLEAALRRGVTAERLHAESGVDPWFLDQISPHLPTSGPASPPSARPAALGRRDWRRAKRLGFSDAQLAYLWGTTEAEVRSARPGLGVRATFKTVDTCAAEFAARTPYHYSTYEDTDEVLPSTKPKVVILGSGPNRIGQGVEFDYCCVQASFALHDAGFETVMVNCNPETVSTDYDTSDRLYFEPVTPEDVQNVLDVESGLGAPGRGNRGLGRPDTAEAFFGHTSRARHGHLARRRSTWPRTASCWNALCERLGIPQAAGGTATSVEEALAIAAKVGYPVLVRPSYVLGGRAMEIAYGDEDLERAMGAMAASGVPRAGGRPVGGTAGAGRQVPRGRHRGRRGRSARRQRRDAHRRRHGARGRGRGAFRRQRLRGAAADARPGDCRGRSRATPGLSPMLSR